MSGILDRIRRVETTPLHGTEAWVELWEVLQDSRAEIERLRLAIRRLAEQDATLSVQGGNLIVEMDATLTDAEREAVEVAISREMDAEYYGGDEPPRVVLLRGLLARKE